MIIFRFLVSFALASFLWGAFAPSAYAATVWCDPVRNAVPAKAGKVFSGEREIMIDEPLFVIMNPSAPKNRRQGGGCTLKPGTRVVVAQQPDTSGHHRVLRVSICGNRVENNQSVWLPGRSVQQCGPNENPIHDEFGFIRCDPRGQQYSGESRTSYTQGGTPSAPQECHGGLYSDCYDDSADQGLLAMEVGTTGILDTTVLAGYRYDLTAKAVGAAATLGSALIVANAIKPAQQTVNNIHQPTPVDPPDNGGGTPPPPPPGDAPDNPGGTPFNPPSDAPIIPNPGSDPGLINPIGPPDNGGAGPN